MKCFTEAELKTLLKRSWWNGVETYLNQIKNGSGKDSIFKTEAELLEEQEAFIKKLIDEV